MRINEYGQPIGETVPNWQPRPLPQPVTLHGQYCRIEPLQQHHLPALYRALAQAEDWRIWTYFIIGPFDSESTYIEGMTRLMQQPGIWQFTIIDSTTNAPLGTFSLMRADQDNGSIEMGWVIYSPLLQRTRIATEAQFLMMQHVFETLGYRRYEWKCDDLNTPSRNAAQRLGFRYEGTFRNAVVYKDRNRDTAWFAATAQDWPGLKRQYAQWLAPDNFDAQGQQKQPFSTFSST